MAKPALPTINTNNTNEMLLGALIEAQSAIKNEIKSMNENLFHGLEDESGKKLDTQTSLIAGGTKTKNLDSVSDNTKKTADMASLNVDIAKTGEEVRAEEAQQREKERNAFLKTLDKFETIKMDFGNWVGNLGNLEDATSKVKANFGKLTQGTGEFGPIFNTIKDTFGKAKAAVFLFTSSLRASILGITKFAKFLLTPIFGKANRTIDAEKTKAMQTDEELIKAEDDITAAHMNIKKVDGPNAEMPGVDVQFVNFVPEVFQNLHKIIANSIKNKGRVTKTDSIVSTEGFDKAQEDAKMKQEMRRDQHYDELSDAEERRAQRLYEIDKEFEEQRNKGLSKFNAFRIAREKSYQAFRFMKEKAFGAFRMTMNLLLNPTFLKIAALGATFAYLKSQIDEFADAPFAGIAKAGDIIVKKVTSMFSSLRAGLAKIPGIGKFFEKKPPKPPKPPKSTAAKVATGAKNVSKQVLKRIPLVGAVAEGAIDATSNEKKFNKIKQAYEAGTPIMPVDPADPEAGLRPMTADEFAAAEQSMKGNRAGSVGRAGGAFAGAATGAAIGSVVPVIGTAVGGVIGAVLGGFFGGRAGDKVATNLVEKAEGVDDPQAYIDMLAANVPELQNEVANDLEAGRTELADATDMTGAGGGDNQTVVSTSSHTNNDIDITSSGSVIDEQMQYSYG
jgi:hypothetical protein